MLDEKELKKRVLDKLLEMHAGEMGKLTEAFAGHVWKVNKMSYEELEIMNNDLLNVLHKEKTGRNMGTYFRSN